MKVDNKPVSSLKLDVKAMEKVKFLMNRRMSEDSNTKPSRSQSWPTDIDPQRDSIADIMASFLKCNVNVLLL